MVEDVLPSITPAQYGGLSNSSTIMALINLLHHWFQALEKPKTAIRVLFLDSTKAFDLINHNKLLQDMEKIGVREALIPRIASYLSERKHSTKVGSTRSEQKEVNGGIPQGSKIGPLLFIIKINGLEEACKQPLSADRDMVIIYMDDSTLSEILDTSTHISGDQIGHLQVKLDAVVEWSKCQDMTLNGKKCKEMIIDFRKKRNS